MATGGRSSCSCTNPTFRPRFCCSGSQSQPLPVHTPSGPRLGQPCLRTQTGLGLDLHPSPPLRHTKLPRVPWGGDPRPVWVSRAWRRRSSPTSVLMLERRRHHVWGVTSCTAPQRRGRWPACCRRAPGLPGLKLGRVAAGLSAAGHAALALVLGLWSCETRTLRTHSRCSGYNRRVFGVDCG